MSTEDGSKLKHAFSPGLESAVRRASRSFQQLSQVLNWIIPKITEPETPVLPEVSPLPETNPVPCSRDRDFDIQ